MKTWQVTLRNKNGNILEIILVTPNHTFESQIREFFDGTETPTQEIRETAI